jgi:hypothetical protein
LKGPCQIHPKSNPHHGELPLPQEHLCQATHEIT